MTFVCRNEGCESVVQRWLIVMPRNGMPSRSAHVVGRASRGSAGPTKLTKWSRAEGDEPASL